MYLSGVSRQDTFRLNWITSLLNNLDEWLNQRDRIAIMESCGRACARQESIKMAEQARGNIRQLVDSLREILGKKNVILKKNTIQMQYDKCYCPLVNKGSEILSDTWCYCSRGWVLEMFETAAEKPVNVDLLQSIKRGDPVCEFTIQIQE